MQNLLLYVRETANILRFAIASLDLEAFDIKGHLDKIKAKTDEMQAKVEKSKAEEGGPKDGDEALERKQEDVGRILELEKKVREGWRFECINRGGDRRGRTSHAGNTQTTMHVHFTQQKKRGNGQTRERGTLTP